MTNPSRLVPQASQYLSSVISGNYLNPASNPNLGALTGAIREQVFPAVTSVFGRAGRGSSANDSGLGGALTRGFTSALAQPLFNQYNQERGFQTVAAGQAGALDAAANLPLEQYLERMRNLSLLASKGTQTSTPSTMQTLAGLGLTAASMFGGGPMGLGLGMGGMPWGGGA
jgi:hypothetical protein